MIKGINWYLLRLHFSDYAMGTEGTLENQVLNLVKRYKLVAATILKESYHFNLLGTPASIQLFGSRPGTKPVIMELFISEKKLDSFIKELEEITVGGKSNILYSKHEVNGIIGNPEVFDKIDDFIE